MKPTPARRLTCAMLLALALLSSGHAQTTQTRYPIISKVELLFSLVTHYSHISDRINFYNTFGNPRGNTNYAVPHLVYDPIVTLYNPYNEPLTMNRSRVQIWDPPVGFAFKKNGIYLRSDFANGTFHGLARFQIQNQFSTTARKSFTLLLTEPNSTGNPGSPITLQPGESRTFSTWVEPSWNWQLETSIGEYTPRSFFDWNADLNFTNRDNRTSNSFGVEAISSQFPYLSRPQAGFQTDGFSYSSGQRPTATLYDFEITHSYYYPWVAIKLTDTVSVETKSMRTAPAGIVPDFQIDLLKGQVADSSRDVVKTFPMTLSGIIQNDAAPVISRTFKVGDILQTATDRTSGGKPPFASLVMLSKTTPLRANGFYKTLGTTPPNSPVTDLYELHFKEVADFRGAQILASDAAIDAAPEIFNVTRTGDTLYVDFTGRPAIGGLISWKVRGSSNLAFLAPDNLDSVSTVHTGQSANGIYKAVINITGKGDRYFIRLEE